MTSASRKIDWDKALGREPPLRRRRRAASCKTIDVTVPMKAGPHQIGVTFLATNYAPGLDMNHAFERSTIETGGLPGFTFYPHVGSVRIDGPSERDGGDGFAEPRAHLHLPPDAAPSEEERCAREIATTLAHRAYRGYATPKNVDTLMSFYALGARKAARSTTVSRRSCSECSSIRSSSIASSRRRPTLRRAPRIA